MDCEDQGLEAVATAKELIMGKQYGDARDCLRLALELFPSSIMRFGMLVIAETLYYGNIELPNCGIDWYSILHLPPSCDAREVKIRYEELVDCCTMFTIIKSLPGATDAISLLKSAQSTLCHKVKRHIFDCERKACLSFEWPNCDKKAPAGKHLRAAFTRKSYLEWKPPLYRVEDVMDMNSRKRQKTGHFSHCAEVEGDPSLSPELRNLKNKVFQAMPQNPHYNPLEKYSAKVQEGMILGLELAFVKLTEEIQKLVDPESFLTHLDSFNEQVSQLEEMGYDVEKVRERLNALKKIAIWDRVSREDADKFECEVTGLKDKESELLEIISQLKIRVQKIKDRIARRKSKIESLRKDGPDEFASVAKSSWNNGNEA